MGLLAAAEETFWERHSNPKSGWSRVTVLPVLLYAVYDRRWRLAGAAVVFTALNPLLFAPPATDDAWMTRAVLAERWWTSEQGNPVLGLSYPNVCNALNVPVSAYAFIAAYRRQPVRAALAGLASMALKLWYVGALVRRYEAATAESA